MGHLPQSLIRQLRPEHGRIHSPYLVQCVAKISQDGFIDVQEPERDRVKNIDLVEAFSQNGGQLPFRFLRLLALGDVFDQSDEKPGFFSPSPEWGDRELHPDAPPVLATIPFLHRVLVDLSLYKEIKVAFVAGEIVRIRQGLKRHVQQLLARISDDISEALIDPNIAARLHLCLGDADSRLFGQRPELDLALSNSRGCSVVLETVQQEKTHRQSPQRVDYKHGERNTTQHVENYLAWKQKHEAQHDDMDDICHCQEAAPGEIFQWVF